MSRLKNGFTARLDNLVRLYFKIKSKNRAGYMVQWWSAWLCLCEAWAESSVLQKKRGKEKVQLLHIPLRYRTKNPRPVPEPLSVAYYMARRS